MGSPAKNVSFPRVEHKIVAAPREGEGRIGRKDMMCFPPKKTKEIFSKKKI